MIQIRYPANLAKANKTHLYQAVCFSSLLTSAVQDLLKLTLDSLHSATLLCYFNLANYRTFQPEARLVLDGP